MFVLSAVTATTTVSRKNGKSHIASSKNVMQHSPVVVPMCVQHSQQQVPMQNNFMCMRMRGWHNNKCYCNNSINITISTNTSDTGTTGTKILKRSKLLRKKRDIIRRRFSITSF